MKVLQIVDLIQGELCNKPVIDSFSHLALSLSALRRGGLYFAKNPDEIESAIALGAYGIIFENFAQMSDLEIAWIKVNSLQEAIARLARYAILHQHIEVFYLKSIEFEIFRQICIDEEVFLYQNDMSNLLQTITQEKRYKAVIVQDEHFLNHAIEIQRSIIPTQKPLKIHIATLFDMRIHYKLFQYHLQLPALFFDKLCAVVHLCQAYDFSFDLARFRQIEGIMPLFVDSIPNLLEYGQSEHVLIAQKDLGLFRQYSDYIVDNGKWGKILLFIPKGFDFEFSHPCEFYENREHLYRLLGDRNFNFGMILGMDIPEIRLLLDRPYVPPSLFA